MDKIDRVMKNGYDMDNSIIYFPVRHHSPACAYHVKEAIKLYKPDAILIEGLEEGNELIDLLAHEDTVTPIATYHSYKDDQGHIGDEGEVYKFYTPYMDSSPELVAIREGVKSKVEVKFIDMPTPYHLISDKKEFHYNLYEQHILFKNKYIKELCKKEGCATFEELWEKLFELDFVEKNHKEFVRGILAYCILTREGVSEEVDEENRLREAYMRMKIREYSKTYDKILVISGGYHTIALLEDKEEFVKPFEFLDKKLNIYPLTYSFDRLDGLRTYASGMPNPNYYNKIFKGIDNKNVFQDLAKEYLIKTIKKLRNEDESISTADGIEAFYMAEELRKLRGKANIGLYELKEAVLSSFIKGELNNSTDKPLRILSELLTGDSIGKLPASKKVPPVILDFRATLERLKLDTKNQSRKDINLEVFRKDKDREKSAFLHKLNFLTVPFAKLLRSTNLLDDETRGNMREVWRIAWSPDVETTLLDLSVYGQSVVEVTENILLSRVKKANRVMDICKLLSDSYYCGMEASSKLIFASIKEVIEGDNNFISQTKGTSTLHYLYSICPLLNIEDRDIILHYLNTTYSKSLYLLSLVDDVEEDNQEEFSTGLNELFNISSNKDFDQGGLIEVLNSVLEKIENPYVHGSIMALLYSVGAKDTEAVMVEFKMYLHSSTENHKGSVEYLFGLFKYAREVIFVNKEMVLELTELISNLDKEQFYALLPKLRRAFAFYTPFETNKIGKRVAEVLGSSLESIVYSEQLDEDSLELAKLLDKNGRERVEEIWTR